LKGKEADITATMLTDHYHVMCFQEANLQDRYQARFSNVYATIKRFEPGKRGLVTVFHKDLQPYATHITTRSRHMLALHFDLPSHKLLVINTHLPSQDIATTREFTGELRDLTTKFGASCTVVTAGDFNANIPHGDDNQANHLRGTFRTLGFKPASPETGYTWKKSNAADSQRSLIDFIMLRGPLEMTAVHIYRKWHNKWGEHADGPGPSDHVVLTAVLNLPVDTPNRRQDRWASAKLKTDPKPFNAAFRAALAANEPERLRLREPGPDTDPETAIGRMWTNFIHCYETAAAETIGKTQSSTKFRPPPPITVLLAQYEKVRKVRVHACIHARARITRRCCERQHGEVGVCEHE
jgi:hypothetical protein